MLASRPRVARIALDKLPLWLALPLGVWLGADLGYWITSASSGATRLLTVAVTITAICILGLSVPRPTRGKDSPPAAEPAPPDSSLL
jgi:hypothetical protein